MALAPFKRASLKDKYASRPQKRRSLKHKLYKVGESPPKKKKGEIVQRIVRKVTSKKK